MTEQEKREKVIKALECCTKKVCIYKDTEKECPYWELCGEYESSFEDCTTALAKDALALLKAQEPVMPVFERQFMTSIEIYDCGKCGTSLGAKGIAKYCMNCGQAVKWE